MVVVGKAPAVEIGVACMGTFRADFWAVWGGGRKCTSEHRYMYIWLGAIPNGSGCWGGGFARGELPF